MPEGRAAIGWYTGENGNAAAAKKFKTKLGDSQSLESSSG